MCENGSSLQVWNSDAELLENGPKGAAISLKAECVSGTSFYCFHVFIMLENDTEWVLTDATMIWTQQMAKSHANCETLFDGESNCVIKCLLLFSYVYNYAEEWCWMSLHRCSSDMNTADGEESCKLCLNQQMTWDLKWCTLVKCSPIVEIILFTVYSSAN